MSDGSRRHAPRDGTARRHRCLVPLTVSRAGRAGLLFAGVLLAFGVGLTYRLRLGPGEFWFNPDEGIYHRIATTPSLDEAREAIRQNVHPPLQYWILRAVASLGDDPSTLRMPSLAAGLLAILAFAWLGYVAGAAEGGFAGGVAGAWFGAWIAALSPGLAVQSVTLRPYSLQALSLALGLGALLRYLEVGRARWLVLVAAAFTTASLLLYSSYIVVGGVGIVLLAATWARRLTRRQALGLLTAFLPVAAALAWSLATHLVPHIIGGAVHQSAVRTWLRPEYVTGPLEGLAALGQAMAYACSRSRMLVVPVLLPALVAVGVACARRRGFVAFLALSVAGLAIALSWAGMMPLGPSRHSFYLVSVVVAGGASGVAWLVHLARTPETGARSWRLALLSVAGAGAAFLAGTLGLSTWLIASSSASGRMDRGDGERLVTRRGVDAVSRLLAQAPPAMAWLTDNQTSMLLLPLAPREGRLLRDDPTCGGQRFEVLGRTFVAVRAWKLPEVAGGPDDLVERALAWMAERGALPGGRVGVVTGGWDPNPVWRLAHDLRVRGRLAALSGVTATNTLGAVVVDVEALRDWRRRQ